ISITWTESVHQTPALLVQAGQSAQMSCSHQLHGAYYHMYWFQQFPGESMELIVHTLPFQPPEFSDIRRQHKYSANKTVYGSVGNQADSLQLSVLKASTVFTQRHGKVSFFFPAYFGGGTKLTVLVKVLEPSAEECQSRGDKKNRKTLVCVASGFYPDVVSVSWRVDGREVAGGVATDTAARRQGRYYDLASSLRVPLTQWFTAGKNFSCTVSFYNGNETVDRSDWVRGIEGM
uniref:Ig-like domain-containing protein n=1 Tax=Scophthalmus maximus TaxID=52904 RepID=A0A8D3B4V2_SCOMX